MCGKLAKPSQADLISPEFHVLTRTSLHELAKFCVMILKSLKST